MKPVNDNEQRDAAQEYASPPCLMHRFDPLTGDRVMDADVVRWRKAERERLIAARLAIPAADRSRLSQRIETWLDLALGDVSGRIVSVYWPFRGEPDLRPWLKGLEERGAVGALPVVVHRHAPLVFRSWRRDEPLEPGVWKIPVPSHGIAVTPDIVIAPVVGFDADCFRLGYGGGFYDRTLADLPRRTWIVGVGYEQQAIRTIYPQDHDVAMEMIVTESGIVSPIVTPADGS
ncbi:5-formyltetrahydrofolate cyclo-ligase [Reyranella soli]|uniref:5-formyltetrahydrofolate cyclo-ligase n=1 Tax=Reyranella soli TaxID=1230389 RepID=A0A512NSF1_9HYPH|nr:5-formyltetrahydrofolate cyclo-ligase [Reyranella soli]GEP61869.1 5-formyltetrahydrofolate cyclo-ligase [Reyranella soli]